MSFVTDPEVELYDDKAPAPGVSLRAGLTDENVTKADNLNRIKDALFDVRDHLRDPALTVTPAAVVALEEVAAGALQRVEALEAQSLVVEGLAVDGVTDDQPALQAAIDAAPVGSILDLPAGIIGLSRPLRLNKSKCILRGKSKDLTKFRNLWAGGGCVIAVGPDESPIPTTTDAGNGQAMDLRGAGPSFGTPGDWYLNMRECDWMELNGKQNICFELQFKTDTTLPDDGEPSVLAYSQGRRFQSEELASAFLIETAAPGDGEGFDGLAFSLTLGGTAYRCTTNAFLEPSTYYHVACNYDGFTMRIWVNGVLEGSLSASGLITQKRHEMMTVGNGYFEWPDTNGVEANPLPCIVDSFRVTNGDRYTGAFTPPAPGKLALDNDTLYVCNFNEQEGPFTIGYGNDGKKNFHMAIRPVQAVEITSAGVESCGFEASYAGAIHAFRNVAGSFKDIDVAVGKYALHLRDNCYLSRIRGVRFVASQPHAWWGISNLYASGPNVIEDVDISSPTYGIVLGTSTVDVKSVFINGCANIGILSRGVTSFDKHSFQSCAVTDENQDIASEACWGFDGPPSAIVTSCALDHTQRDSTLVMVDSRSDGILFEHCYFQVMTGGSAPLFTIIGGAAANEVQVNDGAFSPMGSHPRANVDGHVVYDTDTVQRVVTGSATVLTGETSVDVAFNIAELDASYRIQLTPGADASPFWTDKDTTGFTITLPSPAGSDVPVDWSISR